MCVVCVCVTKGDSGYGCELASTSCKYDLRKGWFICPGLGKGATSETRKYLFSFANVWWRCEQYFVIASGCLDMCIWRHFYVCCSYCVGSVGVFVVLGPLLNIVGFNLRMAMYVVCLCRDVIDVVLALWLVGWSCRC